MEARARVRTRGCVVCEDGAVVGGGGGDVDDADVVEVDAAEADVGVVVVVGPAGVDVGVGVDELEVPAPVVGFDVADGVDVGVAVQFGDAGDYVGVRGVARRARSGVGVDDDLPLAVWGFSSQFYSSLTKTRGLFG